MRSGPCHCSAGYALKHRARAWIGSLMIAWSERAYSCPHSAHKSAHASPSHSTPSCAAQAIALCPEEYTPLYEKIKEQARRITDRNSSTSLMPI